MHPESPESKDKAMTFFHPRWPVLYEDNHLLALYKPAGVIMQRGAGGKAGLVDLAKAWLKQRHGRPGQVFVGMVHRLDGPVAGVVVLARTSKAASRLSAQIRAGTVVKRYLAVVCGRPERDQGLLVSRLVRRGRYSSPFPAAGGGPAAGATASGSSGFVPAPARTEGLPREGREARLTYELLAVAKGRSLLSICLQTGRRHQIRAQLAELGCPIEGDIHYGAPRPLPNGRIALLSNRLTIQHPTRELELVFESPLPEGWPWRGKRLRTAQPPPWWTIEELLRDGLMLPPIRFSLPGKPAAGP